MSSSGSEEGKSHGPVSTKPFPLGHREESIPALPEAQGLQLSLGLMWGSQGKVEGSSRPHCALSTDSHKDPGQSVGTKKPGG